MTPIMHAVLIGSSSPLSPRVQLSLDKGYNRKQERLGWGRWDRMDKGRGLDRGWQPHPCILPFLNLSLAGPPADLTL